MMMMVMVVKTAEDVGGGDEGASVEREFGQGDDGDADAHEDGEAFGEAGAPDDVVGDGLADAVAEHEHADDGEAGV